MPYTSRSPDQASAFVLAALTLGRDSGSHFNCAITTCSHVQSDALRLLKDYGAGSAGTQVNRWSKMRHRPRGILLSRDPWLQRSPNGDAFVERRANL